MNPTPLVYIVDDDPGMRKSLAKVMTSAALDARLFASADEFLDCFDPARSSVLVLDLQMPGMHGSELLRHLRRLGIRIPVIIATGTGTVPIAVETMKLGVVEFLEKPVDPRTLLKCIHQALANEANNRAGDSEVIAIRRRFGELTQREREVLDCVVKGHSNKQIATALGISIKTVAIHRGKVMLKTGAANAVDLVRMSMRLASAGQIAGQITSQIAGASPGKPV